MISSVTAAGAAKLPATEPIAWKAGSKLSLWCDRFIEIGWLAALIVAPLFFNIYSSRVFEPDKITTVRSIALVMAALWLVKWFEERGNSAANQRISWRTPLVLPTLVLIVVYMISTALSVAPRTSLLGSYQRLQGTYSTFSYIIIFLMMLQGMRSRAQLNRAINVIIVNSLPIALYGASQRYGLDPLPWGGDTSQRVAGNMGNAIFIAAYLLMPFFLCIGKLAEMFVSVLAGNRASMSDVVRGACYIIIAAADCIVIMVLAGSRGPQLGWLVGLFFIVTLLLQLLRNARRRALFTTGWFGLALAGLAALVAINFSDSPALGGIKQLPILSRLATAFNTTEGTNLVRALIWEGNVDMMSRHEPIGFPDRTTDPWNDVRILVGYGPESMYVAYNRFYPAGLANIEARNASPDRSHNETWDSVVITGVFGLIAYLWLFGAVFYYAFKWIGLIRNRFERNLFAALWVAGAAMGGIGALLTRPSLFGVAVAAGVCAGLGLYVLIGPLLNARAGEHDDYQVNMSITDRILTIGLISAIVAFFIEIHLGIAIASTRTHFWGMVGLMVVIGMGWARGEVQLPLEETASISEPVAEPAPNPAGGTRRSRSVQQQAAARSTARRSTGMGLPRWFNSVAVDALLLGLILGVMAYDFMTNPERITTPGDVFVRMMTMVRDRAVYGVLGIFLITWIVGSLIFVLDAVRNRVYRMPDDDTPTTGAALALTIALSLLVWVLFGTFLAGRLVSFITTPAQGVDGILGIAEALSFFPAYIYLLVIVLMVAGAWLLLRGEEIALPRIGATATGITALIVLAVLTPFAVSASNLQSIRADIIYKQANPYDGQASTVLQQGTNIQGWDLGIEHHRRAIQLAPNEDFYYLWLGRGLLEKGKTSQSTAPTTWSENTSVNRILNEGSNGWNRNAQSNPLPSASMAKEDLLRAAKAVLEEARRINPLNTDHSANLARMFRQSGDVSQEAGVKRGRYEEASRNYDVATSLSPQNVQLLNEWATLYIQLGDRAKAWEKLEQSAAIDKKFDQTYLLRGDFIMQEANVFEQQRQQLANQLRSIPVTDTAQTTALNQQIAKLSEEYRTRLRTAVPEFEKSVELNERNSQAINVLTFVNQQIGEPAAALIYAEKGIKLNANDWNAWQNVAVLSKDLKDLPRAREAAEKALALAPANNKAALQAFLDTVK